MVAGPLELTTWSGPVGFPDKAGSSCPSPDDARGGCPEGGVADASVTKVSVFLLPDSEDVLDFKLEVIADLSRAKSLAPTFVFSTFWL